MLSNAYFLAKIGDDTAENEQHFAEFLPKIGNYPTPGHRAAVPDVLALAEARQQSAAAFGFRASVHHRGICYRALPF